MSVNSKMTVIANEIRELSGTSNKMNLDDMKTNLGKANDEVGSQAELIAQITSILEGKAADGSSNGELVDYSKNEYAIITRTLSTYFNDSITSIGNYAFAHCSKLTTVSFPACITIGSGAFYSCSKLKSTNFSACTTIGDEAFFDCKSLTSVSFPACTNIGSWAFHNCDKLTTVSFPACTSIGYSAFYCCYNLKSLYLTGSSLCNLSNSNVFTKTPYAGYSASFSGTPYIYVPSSLVDAYKTATNWTYFSSYFSGI